MRTLIKRKLGLSLIFLPMIGMMPSTATVADTLILRPLEPYAPVMQEVADGVLHYIEGRSKKISANAEAPHQTCLRGVKKGLASGGVFIRYPAWSSAVKMASILNNEKKTKKYVQPEYQFVQLTNVKNVKEAPAYSVLIYGGDTNGHIEVKVPASYLQAKGYTYALKSDHGKTVKVLLSDLKYVYMSDYIDAFPRNHPSSRIANSMVDNHRPLKAVFELRKVY